MDISAISPSCYSSHVPFLAWTCICLTIDAVTSKIEKSIDYWLHKTKPLDLHIGQILNNKQYTSQHYSSDSV